MKTYDKVKQILTDQPETRNSDHGLIWAYAFSLDYRVGRQISWETFRDLPLETITRCRRKLQELYPELRATEEIQKARGHKADTKGIFMYSI